MLHSLSILMNFRSSQFKIGCRKLSIKKINNREAITLPKNPCVRTTGLYYRFLQVCVFVEQNKVHSVKQGNTFTADTFLHVVTKEIRHFFFQVVTDLRKL